MRQAAWVVVSGVILFRRRAASRERGWVDSSFEDFFAVSCFTDCFQNHGGVCFHCVVLLSLRVLA